MRSAGGFSDYCDRILQRVYHSDPGNPPGTVIPWKTFHEYFLIHTFIRHYFWSDFIYSFGHFVVNVLVLLGISLAVSIVLEWLKI